MGDKEGDRGTRVYVGGLSDGVKKEDLETEFEKFGKLNSVWVAFNPPGFAFIEFSNHSDAETACDNLNGTDFLGSKLRVEIARGKGRRGGMRGGRGGRRGTDRFRSFGSDRGFKGGSSRGFARRGRGGRSYDDYGSRREDGGRFGRDYGRSDGFRRGGRDSFGRGGARHFDGESRFRSRSPAGGRRR